MRVELLTCPGARRDDSVLSGPIFSRPVNRVQSGSEPMLLKSEDLNWMRPARGLQFRLASCWNPDRTISERPYAAWPPLPFEATLRHSHDLFDPLPPGSALYALVEMQGADPDAEAAPFEAMLETAMEGGLIVDAALARSQREIDDFWALRDGVAEVNARWSPVINFDVSVPLTRIGACVEEIRAALLGRYPAVQCAFFGHAGDSNLHLVAGPIDTIDPTGHGIESLVYGIIRAFGGSISAEHGIGLHKKSWLSYSRNAEELTLLRRLKTLMGTSKNCLNHGADVLLRG